MPITIAGICPKHGFWRGEHCKQCRKESKNTVNIITNDWIKKGVWEHIDPKQPNMKLNSKEELRRECEKRNMIPKAFLKPKSQGKGYEMAK